MVRRDVPVRWHDPPGSNAVGTSPTVRERDRPVSRQSERWWPFEVGDAPVVSGIGEVGDDRWGVSKDRCAEMGGRLQRSGNETGRCAECAEAETSGAGFRYIPASCDIAASSGFPLHGSRDGIIDGRVCTP